MTPLAAVDWGGLLAIVIGIAGLGGLCFTALRFRRSDATEAINQQATILNSMHTLNDDLRVTADTLRSDRDRCYEEVAKLREQTARIERKLDDG